MHFFFLEAEVAGGLGDHTFLDQSVHPPIVNRLHYVLDGWMGDVLLESFPSYIVTEEAKQALVESGVTGAVFDEVQVSRSPEFDELHSLQHFPEFAWLKVTGKAGFDDFGLSQDLRLVISSRVIDILKRLGLNNALIEPFPALMPRA